MDTLHEGRCTFISGWILNRMRNVSEKFVEKMKTLIEGRTDQRNAQINFWLINLLLFKLLRHVSAT